MFIKSLKGCSVFVNDQQGKAMAQTTVQEYDRDGMIITVNSKITPPQSGEYVIVFILVGDNVLEYQGRIHIAVFDMNVSEIALFKGKPREHRRAKRFSVNTSAIVPSLVLDKSRVRMLNPIEVTISNLSVSGAKIQAPSNSFIENAIIAMQMCIGDNETEMLGKIMWVRELDNDTMEYGCRFVSEQ